MARAKAVSTDTADTTKQGENVMADSPKGSLSSLGMIEVTDEELDAAKGGRGHGSYDAFIPEFLAAGIRGTGVSFDGVKANSTKTGLKSAIDRLVKAGTIAEGELVVASQGEKVYLKFASVAAYEARNA